MKRLQEQVQLEEQDESLIPLAPRRTPQKLVTDFSTSDISKQAVSEMGLTLASSSDAHDLTLADNISLNGAAASANMSIDPVPSTSNMSDGLGDCPKSISSVKGFSDEDFGDACASIVQAEAKEEAAAVAPALERDSS